jgi:hypothetical protein
MMRAPARAFNTFPSGTLTAMAKPEHGKAEVMPGGLDLSNPK